jgi:hypothetical protein
MISRYEREESLPYKKLDEISKALNVPKSLLLEKHVPDKYSGMDYKIPLYLSGTCFFKSGIRQHNMLISRKNPEYIEQHSRIISRCLLSFMKTQNRVALKENLNLISSSITKNERNMGQALYELDKVIR